MKMVAPCNSLEANASRGSVYFYNSYFVQPEEVNTGLQGFVFLLDNEKTRT